MPEATDTAAAGSRKRLLLVSTGGTITMTAGTGAAGIAPTLTGDDLVRAVPALANVADIDVHTYSQKPGASLTLDDLVQIAGIVDRHLATGHAGAIVVQGTDTLEETAFVLNNLVASDKPVVVTGAMRGAAAPGADGPANLLASAVAASSAAAIGLGTVVVMNDEVHAAHYVQKSHTAATSAFTSPGFGPIGRIVEGTLHLYARPPRFAAPLSVKAGAADDMAVALIKVVLGDDGRLMGALPSLGYRGAVIEAMGVGHLPARLAEPVSALVEAMPVVLASRVAGGPVHERTYGFAGSEMDLIARGAIPGGYLAGGKACLLLRLLLASGLEGERLKTAYRERSSGLVLAPC